MKKALGVGVALAASVAFADGGWGEIHGSYSLDFESASSPSVAATTSTHPTAATSPTSPSASPSPSDA